MCILHTFQGCPKKVGELILLRGLKDTILLYTTAGGIRSYDRQVAQLLLNIITNNYNNKFTF
jgi:hypothetical protein